MLPPAVAGAQEGLISHPLVDDNANIVHTHISSHGRSESNVSIESEESLAVDDAENPLQLLARASDLQSPQQPEHASLPTPSAYTHSSSLRDRQEDAIQSFFTSTKVSLDVGEDLDPVHMGLVTLEETESLFKLSVCFLPSMCPSCALANHTWRQVSMIILRIHDGAWTLLSTLQHLRECALRFCLRPSWQLLPCLFPRREHFRSGYRLTASYWPIKS
jgi:hypothetical protein